MAKRVLMEEYHLSVFVLAELPEAGKEAVRRALDDPAFERRLLRAVRRAFRREPGLRDVKVRISR